MRNNYDEDYYLIQLDVDDPKIPYLKPDENTSSRRFLREGPAPGSPAMVFFNGHKKNNLKRGIVSSTFPILFAGFDLVVHKDIRDKLLLTPVRDLNMHPTVYIDDKDQWHEDYWYLTFSKELDCWDRERSRYNKNSTVEVGGETLFEVYAFRLNANVLDKIRLEDRLLFMMGGAMNSLVFVHKSLRSIFSAGGNCGAKIMQVSEKQ